MYNVHVQCILYIHLRTDMFYARQNVLFIW